MNIRIVIAGDGLRPTAVIDRASRTDLMQLASDLPTSPMQAAVLVLGDATALDLTAVRDAIGLHRRTGRTASGISGPPSSPSPRVAPPGCRGPRSIP